MICVVCHAKPSKQAFNPLTCGLGAHGRPRGHAVTPVRGPAMEALAATNAELRAREVGSCVPKTCSSENVWEAINALHPDASGVSLDDYGRYHAVMKEHIN